MRFETVVIASIVLLAACRGSGEGGTEGSPWIDDLAGNYYYGDGLGVNCRITLTSPGRFSYKWTGCLGTYAEDAGSATLKDGVLLLRPFDSDGKPDAMIPVRWGTRIYLVPRDEFVKFVNEVNQGMEPRDEIHGSIYLRDEDWNKTVAGIPDLPEEWRPWLLPKPLIGKIVEAAGDNRWRINLGSQEGLRPGMVVTAQGSMFTQLKVVSVEKDVSIVGVLYDNSPGEGANVRPGLKVTSRFHDE